jgi:hypothetical protein
MNAKLSEAPALYINLNLQLVSNKLRHTGGTRLEPSHRTVANSNLRHFPESIQTNNDKLNRED